MKQIVFIREEKAPLPERTLDLFSRYTPLVEVLVNQGVLLDLSGCGPVEVILDAIGQQAYTGTGQRLKIGLAACRLLALCALELPGIPVPASCFSRIEKAYGQLLRVLPGKEKQFLSSFPLEKFPPLKKEEIRKLRRAALVTVGEIADSPPSRLFSLLGERAFLLLERSRGIDPTPVLGTYPPLQLTYPFTIDTEKLNWQVLGEQFKSAARQLTGILGERGCGCSKICLELEQKGEQKIERRLSTPCFEAPVLFNIIMALLERIEPARGILRGRIGLEEITVLQWQEQDLFLLPAAEKDKKWGEKQVENILENLENRFPGIVVTGGVVDRREQVLALFDPWRCWGR